MTKTQLRLIPATLLLCLGPACFAEQRPVSPTAAGDDGVAAGDPGPSNQNPGNGSEDANTGGSNGNGAGDAADESTGTTGDSSGEGEMGTGEAGEGGTGEAGEGGTGEEGEGGGEGGPEGEVSTVEIGPRGGEFNLGELLLVVPRDAFSAPTMVTSTRVATTYPGHEVRSATYRLAPAGLQLAAPIQITIPLDRQGDGATSLRIHLAATTTDSSTEIDTLLEPGGRSVSAGLTTLGQAFVSLTVCNGATAAPCAVDQECGDCGWCRQEQDGTKLCAVFVTEGSSCGGLSEPWNFERCSTGSACDLSAADPGAAGTCVCERLCDGKVCGPDGCGGQCGTCPGALGCSTDGAACVDGLGDDCSKPRSLSIGEDLQSSLAGQSDTFLGDGFADEVVAFEVPEAGTYQFSTDVHSVATGEPRTALALGTTCGAVDLAAPSRSFAEAELNPQTTYYLLVHTYGQATPYTLHARRADLLYTPPTGATLGRVAVDASYVYWTESGPSSGRLLRLPKNGGATQILAEGLDSPRELLVGPAAVFLLDRGLKALLRVPKNGGLPLFLASDQPSLGNLAISASEVFWTVPSGAPCVSCATARGVSANCGPIDDGQVRKVVKTGGSVATVAAGEYLPKDLAIDDTHVYWTRQIIDRNLCWADDSHAVKRVPLAGGGIENLLETPSQAQRIVLTDDDVLYARASSSDFFTSTFLYSYPKAADSAASILERESLCCLVGKFRLEVGSIGNRVLWGHGDTGDRSEFGVQQGNAMEVQGTQEKAVCRSTIDALDNADLYGRLDNTLRRCPLP